MLFEHPGHRGVDGGLVGRVHRHTARRSTVGRVRGAGGDDDGRALLAEAVHDGGADVPLPTDDECDTVLQLEIHVADGTPVPGRVPDGRPVAGPPRASRPAAAA
ncbi:hypothetical protein GCM10009627_15420 [Curtobacterium herbarum]|uniref:Uncharacterized protein n=1 Tax=Curtobacterium herbarum TaxID=150122 RepID=A0ABP4K2Y7_9MICO